MDWSIFNHYAADLNNEHLDEFDQQLLAENSQQQYSQYPPKFPRITLPSTRANDTARPQNTFNLIRNDLYNLPQTSGLNRSSALGSSPFNSIQRNSRQNKFIASTFEQPRYQTIPTVVSERGCPTEQHENINREMQSKKLTTSTAPVIQGIQLVPTMRLPEQFRSVFPHLFFNAVQSKCFSTIFETDDNFVLCAPTGSGKTAVLEIAICRLIIMSKNTDFKVVYQAPTKSLCAERYRDWKAKFSTLDIQCAELTGDTDHSNIRNVRSANIIITTPEKWDSVTRKWKDHIKLLRLVKLFLVDEVHILKESRGAALEAVISRMKSIKTQMRFVALSATIPNPEDISTWLGKSYSEQHLPAHQEVLGERFRPVQLKKYVYGFDPQGNDFAFDASLTRILPSMIAKHGEGKPIMIFCPTRAISIKTAKSLAQHWHSSSINQRPWTGLQQQVTVINPELSNTISTGVAFHHAGLDQHDRQSVEQGFLDRQIRIICSTSTLALGVNLPCYMVILKGTVSYTDNGLKECSDLDVMQMMGRAGRPQFESSACAVILTQHKKVEHYQTMLSGQETLESCLHQNLIEHLNAEISLGTIYDTCSARQWLESTFLYIRVRRNPKHYHQEEDVGFNGDNNLVDEFCKQDIELLQKYGLVESGQQLKCTEFGEAMARYYVKFATMKLFVKLAPKAKVSEILLTLSEAAEFQDVRLKAGERSLYKEINSSNDIKYPINVNIALNSHKVSLIIQIELGSIRLSDTEKFRKHLPQFNIDKAIVFSHVNRLIRCIIDCQLYLQDAVSARHALELGRSLAARVWDNTANQLKQLDGIGDVATRKLASAGITSIEALSKTEAHNIELALGKLSPYGHKLLQTASKFPVLRVSVSLVSKQNLREKGLKLKLKAEIGFMNNEVTIFFKKKQVYVCFLAESSDGHLLDFRRFDAKKIQDGEEIIFVAEIVNSAPKILCHVMCDELAGTNKCAELNLNKTGSEVFPTVHDKFNNQNPTQKPTTLQPSRELEDAEESFDCDVNDQDLLSIEAANTELEYVHDIDSAVSSPDQVNLKHSEKHSIRTAAEDVQQQTFRCSKKADTEYHKPVKLANGRWTCQHECLAKKKHCKHRCCKEGVLYPRRNPRKDVRKIDRENSQDTVSRCDSIPQKRPQHDYDDEHVQVLRDDDSDQHSYQHKGYESPIKMNDNYTRKSKKLKSHPTGYSDALCADHFDDNLPLNSFKNEATPATLPLTSSSLIYPPRETTIFESTPKFLTDSKIVKQDTDHIDIWDLPSSDELSLRAEDFDDNLSDGNSYNTSPNLVCRTPTDDKKLDQTGIEAFRELLSQFSQDYKPSSLSTDEDVFHKTKYDSAAAATSNWAEYADIQDTESRSSKVDTILNSTNNVGCHRAHFENTKLGQDSYLARLDHADTPNAMVSADHGSQTATTISLQDGTFPPKLDVQQSDEEQRKKWADLDPWLYEQFHNYIELI